jgi:hypothetical protein
MSGVGFACDVVPADYRQAPAAHARAVLGAAGLADEQIAAEDGGHAGLERGGHEGWAVMCAANDS